MLLDSEGQYSIFWGEMEKEYPTGVPDFAAYIKGFHLNRILGYFADEAVRTEIIEKLLEFERSMRYVFFPGALDFVKQLRDAGVPMAIVTSSDRKKMQALYSQYPEFPTLFDQIITGDMVTRAKPDPDCFLLGAKLIGVGIKDCIVFEDSRNGLIAARQCCQRADAGAVRYQQSSLILRQLIHARFEGFKDLKTKKAKIFVGLRKSLYFCHTDENRTKYRGI